MKLKSRDESTKRINLINGIKISEGFNSDNQDSDVVFLIVIKQWKNKERFFWDLPKEAFFIKFRLFLLDKDNIIDKNLIREIVLEIFLQFRLFGDSIEYSDFRALCFKYPLYFISQVRVQFLQTRRMCDTLSEFLDTLSQFRNFSISKKKLLKIRVQNIKYDDSANRINDGILILKHPVVIDYSGLYIDIHKFDKIDDRNRQYNRYQGNNSLSYTISERREIITPNGEKRI